MYPLLRFLSVGIKATLSQKIEFNETSVCSFRAHPTDIDLFMEVNNGRHLTLFDLGRFDLAIKCGLPKALRDEGWGLVVAGGSVRYRHRIRMFDMVTMRTQMIATDPRWFYFYQAMFVKGRPCSSTLLRTGVTKNGQFVRTESVFEKLGASSYGVTAPQWVEEWIQADEKYQWPPDL